MIYIHFNLVLTFEIEPKQGNVENVNRFKNEEYISYLILVGTGSIRVKFGNRLWPEIG